MAQFLDKNGLSYLWSIIKERLDDKANKSFTLAGYGIQNAYTRLEVDQLLETVGGTSLYGTSLTISREYWSYNAEGHPNIICIVPEITENSIVFVSPDPNSYDAYVDFGVRAVSQSDSTLILEAVSIPSDDITVNIVVG